MGNPGHTPGPWRVPTHAPFQVLQMSALPGDAAIAVVYEDERRGRSKAERDANARLIVEAVNSHDANQELLEAAKEVASWEQDYGTAERLYRSIGTLRKAIARVEESRDGS